MGWGVLRGGRQGETAFSDAAGLSVQGSRSTSQRGRLTAAEEVLWASAAMQARRLPLPATGGLSSCSEGCAMRLLQAVHIHSRCTKPRAALLPFHAEQHR